MLFRSGVFFNVFINVLKFSVCRSFTSLVDFIPRYFVLFDAVVNRVAFFFELLKKIVRSNKQIQ